MKEDGLEWKMQQRVKQGENLAEAIRFDKKKKKKKPIGGC